MCQLLGKLYLPDTVDDDKIKTLKLLVYNIHSVCADGRLVMHRVINKLLSGVR
jgi:hypothetical protein